MAAKSIDARQRPICLLCGSPGQPAHTGLRDRLFGAPGEWDLHCCENRDCGLYWLNPMPEPDDLPIAYEAYYTHEDGPGEEDRRAGPWPGSWVRSVHRMIMSATGTTRARRLADDSYLADTKPGRVLEVGCGDGSRLLRLRKRGWLVVGQDVDPHAGAHALAADGITVYGGNLEALHLPDGRYDAIVMNHVIEHAVDPLGLLQECHRLLVPGGQLVVVTPNALSFGHRFFGAYWVNLDPPRHLFLFSARNLPTLARKAGHSRLETRTSAAAAAFSGAASWDIWRRGRHDVGSPPPESTRMVGLAFQIAASLAIRIWRRSGEEIVLRAWK
jgi:SAM-dependent methyltransferase